MIWNINYKQTYKKYFDINKVKIIYELNDNIIAIYNNTKLYLSFRRQKIRSIPSEIGQLINLQILNLSSNGITSIPSEIRRSDN